MWVYDEKDTRDGKMKNPKKRSKTVVFRIFCELYTEMSSGNLDFSGL